MGITDYFSDMMASVVGLQEAHAEAPAEDAEESQDDGGEEKSSDDAEEAEGGDEKVSEEDGSEGAEAEEKEEEEAEEEEEEDDEPVDPKPKLEADCAKSAQCAPYKHHYDECVERVTQMHENPEYKGPKEDCVEEFFHLQHCATGCAAPKLFKVLK